ncbi:hypothetical protein CDL12_13832 [Handroanthus impetiginosus]|uniref:Uncharacterized protein n=1 Tax=Handroanthus impetiginosus TaxID=429701 RepID=A0A2G9H7P9_9LAMI|nr:hypothetical protein CDL12_13832 [Handroanthus impetiginosus]
MCTNANEWRHIIHVSSQKRRRTRVRVLKLSRRKQGGGEEVKDMKLKNLKLYMENISILEENEKLRKQATLLYQEKLALISEFQKRSFYMQFHVHGSQ